MKKNENLFTRLIPVFLCSLLISFSFSPHLKTSASFDGTTCDSVPALNKKLISFVNSKMKKRVGSGQCWDLAQQALNENNATWDGLYNFGKEINYRTDCIYPGDIMQFEGVFIEYEKDGGRWQESMGHHTAFIYEVKGTGDFILAHQNFGPSGKKVGLTPLNLANIKKGNYKIFRPVE